MSQSTINSFFPTENGSLSESSPIAETEVESTGEKRSLPHSPGISISPEAKRITVYDGDTATYTYDKDSDPHWVPYLFKVMDSLHATIDELRNESSLQRAAYESKIASLESVIKVQNDKNKALQKRIDNVEFVLDKQEQYSRRNCLLIHGVPEEQNEKTDIKVTEMCKEDLGITLNRMDIDRSHRIGAGGGNKPRPIIMKFSRYNVRAAVFRAKKKLKGKPRLITESLTKSRLSLLKTAWEKLGKENVWTVDGEIFSKMGEAGAKKVENITEKLYFNKI